MCPGRDECRCAAAQKCCTVFEPDSPSGVTLSFAPRSAAWRTPPSREVGIDSARILTYSWAESSNPGEAAASGPMYSAIRGLATASRRNISPIPEIRLVLAAVLTTPSPGNSDTPSRFFLVSPPFAKADAYRFAEKQKAE